MRRWLLPEAIEDVLPGQAWQVEMLRRRILDEFVRQGYEFVMPPMLEYVESLLTGSGHDMDLRTFKLVDQLSGRMLGLRADITPQAARIDAHLLNREGVTRLCYCGSVLHAVPSGLMASREPLQIGAELYGNAGLEADNEILHLLGDTLKIAALPATRIDLGHMGLFRALVTQAELNVETEQTVFAALQSKDMPTLRGLLSEVSEPARSALLSLPSLYGGQEVLDKAARCFPISPEITTALDTLTRLAADLSMPVGFDLADLRGYHYHSGVIFAAYCEGASGAIALGGRYDKVGQSFGRDRPATGFSMDLREISKLRIEHG